MSILNTFDSESREIIDPKVVIEKVENFPETVVVAFSCKYANLMSRLFHLEQISFMVAGSVIPIYRFDYKGKSMAFYLTPIGGPTSAALLEEIIAKGGKNILFFGSCGSLDKHITEGNLIIPAAAYRDEGTSYHYAPASDYIEIASADRLASIFDDLGIAYRKAKIWTTDSFYRETVKNMEARKKDGCVAVDMECASVMACGQFRGVNVYEFVYSADCLDGVSWNARILGNMPEDMKERILHIALEAAIRI